jgi:ABC-type multidrug transport system, ATPase component
MHRRAADRMLAAAWRARSRSPICCSTCRWRKICGWRRRCWSARALLAADFRSRIASARVAELLERFGLAGKAALSVAQLSHGEQRRLEVAVALAGKPKVLCWTSRPRA